MAINKVVYGDTTLIDISDTTALEEDVASGKYFYTADGLKHEGSSSGGGDINWDNFISGSYPSGIMELTSATTAIADNWCRERSGIRGVVAPYVTTVGSYGFYYDSNIKSLAFPRLTSIATYGFAYCRGVTDDVIFPECTTIAAAGMAYFGNSTTRPAIVLPKVSSLAADAFRQSYTSAIDLGSSLASLPNRAIYNTTYPIVILRRTSGITAAANANAIGGISSTSKVYVPSALIDSYKAASYWSAKGNIFYAIEGSEYENYYADGTPIS